MENFWASTVTFVTSAAKLIAGAILPIGKRINVDNPNSNSSIEKIPFPTVGKPPVGWSTFRHRVIREAELTRPPLPAEGASINSDISMQ